MLFPIEVVRFDKGIPLPTYSQPGDAGMDLYSTETVTILQGCRRLVGTGIGFAIPQGYVGLIHPRSGLAHKHGITVVNAPGTIDSGYRGEVKVNLLNTDLRGSFTIERGDRIAQIVFQPIVTATLREVEALEDTPRGTRGHGSTGIQMHFSSGSPVHWGGQVA